MNTNIHPFLKYRRLVCILAFSLLLSPLFPANADAERYFLPGGMPFGVRFSLAGVPIESITEVITAEGNRAPAADAGLQPGDLIQQINGKPVTTAAEICEAITACEGKPLLLKVSRATDTENEPIFCTLRPVPSLPDGVYRAGMWLRDSTAGIGTVTLIDAETGLFAGLGHGVCRESDGTLLPLLQGSVYRVRVQGIQKGKAGLPGQLRGSLYGNAEGQVCRNTECGIIGRLTPTYLSELSRTAGEALPIAEEIGELREGEATILCTLGEAGIARYPITVEKICGDRENKNLLLRVTDPALLAETGGIVQGMSGSPILQDGKIVGAVTHVMVDDPTCGYGIFIGNMLREIPAA